MSDLRTQLQDVFTQYSVLTPKLLVEVARPESHPLHDRFEWDDTVAGEKYRQVQAAELIRSVKISYTMAPGAQPHSVRAFHSVPRPEGRTYEPIESIADNDFTRQLVIRTAEREWRAMKKRYGHLVEFIELIRKDVAS